MGMFSKLFGTGKHKCLNHPQKNAISFCVSCKQYFCEDCLTKVSDFYFCGSNICKTFKEKKIKQAMNNVIVSGARSLADDIINLIDGFLSSPTLETFNIPAIYIEIICVCVSNLMDLAPQYLDEEEKIIFLGSIIEEIQDVLAARYSDQIGTGDISIYFKDMLKIRRMEYLTYDGLNPKNWSDNLMYMSFGKAVNNIIGKEADLETDANIQTLYVAATMALMLIREHLEEIEKLKNTLQ